jgi:hypothetical protein
MTTTCYKPSSTLLFANFMWLLGLSQKELFLPTNMQPDEHPLDVYMVEAMCQVQNQFRISVCVRSVRDASSNKDA